MKQWLLVRFTLATLLVDKLDQVGVVVKIVPAFVLISSTVINTRGQVVADSNMAGVAVVHDTPATLSGSGAHDTNATVQLFAAVPKHDGTSKCVFVCPWTSKSSWRGFFGLDFHNSVGPMRIGSFEVCTFFSGFSISRRVPHAAPHNSPCFRPRHTWSHHDPSSCCACCHTRHCVEYRRLW